MTAAGVVLLERTRKAAVLDTFMPTDDKVRGTITERLYRCSNGWQLGARRGGLMHLADADTWEVFVLDPVGIVRGETAGFVDEETLARAVDNLANWFGTRCEANRQAVPA